MRFCPISLSQFHRNPAFTHQLRKLFSPYLDHRHLPSLDIVEFAMERQLAALTEVLQAELALVRTVACMNSQVLP